MAITQEVTQTARPALVHTVAAKDEALRRTYPAIAFPSREVELSFRVGGRLVDLPIRAARGIAEGDIVAKLDTRDFEAEVARLESQKEEALAQLSILRVGARPEEIAALEAALDAASAQLDQVREEYQRTLQLVEREVVSAAQLEQREAAFRVAEAEVASRREQLTIGQSGGRPEEILAAEAAIRGLDAQIQSARDSLADATLRAPFDSTVARRYVENFSNVVAGEPIALIQNLSTLEVGFDLPGADIVAMSAIGFDNVLNTVVFDALPELELDGELVEFATQADAATQTYHGRLSVTIPDGAVVLPGMVASVILTAENRSNEMLTVPLSALAADPDGSSFVWLVDPSGNTVARQPVSLGDASTGEVVVTSGLEIGDLVVTSGVSQLQDGMEIRPVSKIGD